MRCFIALIVLLPSLLKAQDCPAGSFSSETNPVLRITEALVGVKDDSLTPHFFDYHGKRISYHLGSVRYLGKVSRGSQTFVVATALFHRSSPEGQEQPPARAHGFLLLLDEHYHLTSHCSLDFSDQVELIGKELCRIGKLPFESEKSVIGDLGLADIASRTRGFLIDGDGFLPYPFSDRIAEPGANKNQ